MDFTVVWLLLPFLKEISHCVFVNMGCACIGLLVTWADHEVLGKQHLKKLAELVLTTSLNQTLILAK